MQPQMKTSWKEASVLITFAHQLRTITLSDLRATEFVTLQAKTNNSPLRLGINDIWFHKYLQQAAGALAVSKASLLGRILVSNKLTMHLVAGEAQYLKQQKTA